MLIVTLIYMLLCFTSLMSSWAEDTLATLTLEEKIAQLFVVRVNFDASTTNHQDIASLIHNYTVGGVIFLRRGTIAQQYTLTRQFQERAKIPLIIMQDAEWGLSMHLIDAIRLPHAMTLGAVTNRDLVYALGYTIGKTCKALGVHMNLAPVADVNNNIYNPVIHDRSFGSQPERVAQAATAYMQGIQSAGILACAKHFPGHGDTTVDSHYALPNIPHTLEHLHQIELVSFKQLIQNGIAAVMTAHVQMPALDARDNRSSSLSYAVTTALLQQQLGFNGLVITDALDMRAITQHYTPGQAALEAFIAGADILLCSTDIPAAVAALKQAVHEEKISIQELDRRVLKILSTKERVVLPATVPSLEEAQATINHPDVSMLKRTLYQQAITMLNTQTSCTLSPQSKNALVQIGGQPNSTLITTLQQEYQLPCDYFYLEYPNDIAYLTHTLASYTTVVYAFLAMNKHYKSNYGINPQIIQAVPSAQPLVVLFGTPYAAQLFKNTPLLIAYENDDEAQRAVAQVLAGALEPKGMLPVTL